jgi:membrane protein DedA with SNARE-associated domain
MLKWYIKDFAVHNIFSHTQHIALCFYFTWQLISAITVGRHQASKEEHKNIQKLYVQ